MISTVHCVDVLKGGVANSLFSYAEACRGVSFGFITAAPVDEAARKHAETLGCSILSEGASSARDLKRAIAEARELTGADIFHVHRNWHNLLPARCARAVGYRVVISHSHNVFPSTSPLKDVYHTAFRILIKRYANGCWGCSPEAIEFLYGEAPSNPLFVPNPVDFSLLRYSSERRDATRRRLGLGDSLVMLHSGLAIPQKNHSFLLRVFKGVLEAMPSARLLLLGPDAENDASLVAEAEELGVREGVIFCGYVGNVADYYAAADLFLFPSLNEGLSLALCEAQAEGLSFIASDRITRESNLFGNGEFLSIDEGPEVWARRILKGGYERHVPSAEQIAKCPFNVEWCAPRLERTYEALLDGATHADVLAIWAR